MMIIGNIGIQFHERFTMSNDYISFCQKNLVFYLKPIEIFLFQPEFSSLISIVFYNNFNNFQFNINLFFFIVLSF